jgi:hypothetical protein
MGILKDKEHYLHKKLKLEPYGEGDYFSLLSDFKIPVLGPGEKSDDNAMINLKQMGNHFRFFYDYQGCESEIPQLFQQSELNQKEYLLTYFYSPSEIVKIRVKDFIRYWDDLNGAVAGQGMVYISEDGKLVLEFTDDYKHHLNSNFLIER